MFSHGQLYVAFSRVSNFESLKVYIENHESKQGNFLPLKYEENKNNFSTVNKPS